MKPFNMDRAMCGHSVVTRKGDPVTVLAYYPPKDRPDMKDYMRLHVLTQTGVVEMYYPNGKKKAGYDSVLDLFMAPRTQFLNISQDGHPSLWPSESSARANSNDQFMARAIHVEY
jgi:hypothetical protein